MKVAVLSGGIGGERQVSLQSGRCVAEALTAGGVDVVPSDISPDGLSILDRADIDVFFLALHGEFGEDGRLQQILEDRNLAYTGSGPEASRLAFDKVKSKELFAGAGVTVAPTVLCDAKSGEKDLLAKLEALGRRFVIKPIRQGSSVGVRMVEGPQATATAAVEVFQEFGDCLIEPFIVGQEITVGVLGRQVLPIIEIRSQTGFYDYEAKYFDDQTQYLFDTIGDTEWVDRIGRDALACFDALGCRDFSRVDFIVTDDGTAYALEINTIPGFTTHSLLPKAAEKVGFSMTQLCVKIVETSFSRKAV